MVFSVRVRVPPPLFSSYFQGTPLALFAAAVTERGIHHKCLADLPVTQEMRERLLSGGRARPHRAGSRGYVSYPMESREDASAVLEILRSNYERAKAAAERRVAGRAGDGAA